MNKQTQQKPANMSRGGSSNPLARALHESEKTSIGGDMPQNGGAENSLFSQALSKLQSGDLSNSQTDQLNHEQQAQLEAQRKKELQRKKLHDQINPVNTVEVFSRREQRVKEQINKVRQDLQLLAKDIADFRKEVDVTLHQEVVKPGQEGSYYLSFFKKLRHFIMMLRQKVKSARTWAKQMHLKSKKKKKKRGKGKFSAGIEVSGSAHEQGKSVHDMMHHENNVGYGG